MRRSRLGVVLILMAILVGPLAVRPSPAQAAGGTPPIAPLPDGRVLIVGLGGVQIYDPATGSTIDAARPAEQVGYGHTLTTLRDGRVLLTGGLTGSRGSGPLARAERFDVATGRWTPAAPLRATHTDHAAVLLADGRVLVAGGADNGTAEIYDPVADRWTPAGAPRATLQFRTVLTLLTDGSVLATGGQLAERYDPATGRWRGVARPREERLAHTATLLADGRVLVAGGKNGMGELATAELFDPAADRWADARPLQGARAAHTATLLPDGRVLVAGGGDPGSSVSATVEVYDPTVDRWTLAPPQGYGHTGHAALLLPNGRLLLVGGSANVGRTEQYGEAAPERCFPETGQCVGGLFLAHWEAHGGLAINGFPLAAPQFERLEDGKTYLVQYFERTRLELHPETLPAYESAVLLGQFGRRIHPADPPAAPLPGARYFPETGHNLGGGFRDYWERHGGLAQFGFPLSEEYQEAVLENGAVYIVQYFERARFEYHPENAAPYDVLLGQFGRRILAENDRLAGSFRILYIENEAVRARLGAPNVPQVQLPGVTQAFERGRMIYFGPTTAPVAERIYVLCGDAQAGALVTAATRLHFPNTWAEGQDPGGGPAPVPGLFLPRRGFGKVWREEVGVRDCVGYALTADEQATALTVQTFERGLMVGLALPEGQTIYVIEAGRPGKMPTYERYDEPRR